MEHEPAELIDKRVAARIRERRIDMGITLQTLARQIGVAFQQAHKYERGLSRISAGRLYHVARVLEAPVGFFFTTSSGPLREEPKSTLTASGHSNDAQERKDGTDVNNAA
jgi:transcriptional regulator with XRE-family HTH domain